MVEIIFWIVCVYVCYQFNKELHRDIFDKELRNDLHNRWYHRVGDTDANKQWLEMELRWVIF